MARFERLVCGFFLAASCFFLPFSTLLAKPAYIKTGINHYMRGEFSPAVVAFQRALKGKLGKTDKVKALKFLGLSFFTMGKLPEAEQSFVRCIDLDDNCTIYKEEALDESVVVFFKRIREGGSPSSIPPSPETPSPPEPTSPAPVPPPLAVSASGTRDGATLFVINSNAAGASILLDGILAGPTGTPMASSEGTVEVEVIAKGYKPRRIKLSVSKGMLNTFQIDLLPDSAKDKARADKDKDREKERRSPGARKGRKNKDDILDEPELLVKDDAESDDLFSAIKKEQPEAKPMPIKFYHLLPLGGGQIYNGDYLLGVAVAAAQAYSAYSIYETMQNIDTATANLNAVNARAKTDPSFSSSQLSQFKTATTVYLENEEQTQTTFIFALAGSYVFGVAQAIIYRPDVPVKSSEHSSDEPGFKWSLERPTPKKLQLVLNWKF